MSASRIGEYEVTGTLGRGGMGYVHRARDRRDGREVALKVLLVARSADPTPRRRFAREVEALARLSHPNAVRLLGSGEDQGTPYLALELLEGGSLEERLARGGPLSPSRAAEVVLALAGALGEAHRLGLVHRDLKPSNVLFDAAGTPKVTDFGLVKDLDPARSRLSQSGQASGTPGFWAPEQAVGDAAQLGPATDVYGLGALLFAALTGRAPFLGSSMVELAIATTSLAPDPPSRLRTGVPAALDEVCLRCLAKEPRDRYSDCAALAADLQAFLDDPAGPGASASGAGPRRSLLAFGLAAALVVAAALALAVRSVTADAPVATASPAPQPPAPQPPAPQPPAVPRPAPRDSTSEVPRVAPETGLRRAPAEPPTRPDAGESGANGLEGAARDALEQASELLRRGDHAAARARFDAALDLAPPTAQALVGRGMARAGLGDRAGAIADYTAALGLDPKSTDAHVNRAMLRGQTNDLDGAIADYTAALAIDAGLAQALGFRGNTHLRRGDQDAAVADWSAALRLDPRLTYALFNRGLVRLQRGDPDGAIADLTAALEAGHARPADVLSVRGDAHVAKGDATAAARDYAAALEAAPTHRRADELRAYLREHPR